MASKQTHVVRVYNRSKQMIPLQLRPPGSDFFRNEHQIRLFPNKDVLLPKTHMIQEQLTNLRSRGMIQITFDSEADEGEGAILGH